MTKRRPSGFGGPSGGGMGNMGGLMKQVQKMQEDMAKMKEDMAKAQEALAAETLEISVAGGAITVVITGHQRVKAINIKPELLDTSDPEWTTDLQDLLVAAVNQAIEQSQKRAAERMEAISGNMDLSALDGTGLGDLLGG